MRKLTERLDVDETVERERTKRTGRLSLRNAQ